MIYHSIGLSSTNLPQSAPKATEFDEIMQNKGHYTIQGHSGSPIWY